MGYSPHAGYDAKRSMRAIEKKMADEAAAGRPADVMISVDGLNKTDYSS